MSINDVVCRACMRECSETRNIQSSNFQSLKTVYTDLTLLQVTDDDFLPQFLCSACSDELLLFKNFKSTCIDSDLQLRLKLATIKVEFVDTKLFADNVKVEPSCLFEDENFIEKTGEIQEINVIKDPSGPNIKIVEQTYVNQATTDGSIFDGAIVSKPYKCKYVECGLLFRLKINLEGHLRCHEKKIPFNVCDICLVPLKTEYWKQLHRMEEHNNITYQCSTCNKDFKTRLMYNQHMSFHGIDSLTTCLKCVVDFDTKEALNLHRKLVHDSNNKHKCICSKTFVSPYRLKKHMKIHTGGQRVRCETCGIFYSKIQYLENHQKTCKLPTVEANEHSPHLSNFIAEKMVFVCLVCNAKFSTKVAFERHTRIHGLSINKCPSRQKAFLTKLILERQMISHTGRKVHTQIDNLKPVAAADSVNNSSSFSTEITMLSCTICNAKFKNKEYLGRHKRNVHGLKNYKCSSCPRAFLTKFMLERHMISRHPGGKVHTQMDNLKPVAAENSVKNMVKQVKQFFQCELCGKKVTHMQTLKTHQNRCRLLNVSQQPSLLSAERMVYPCKLCEIEFDVQETYQSHVRQHHDSRKQMCTICSKMFNSLAQLQVHMVSHTEERPFKCGLCEKDFKNKKYIKQHHKKVHLMNIEAKGCEKQVFRCAVCNIECSDRLALLRHKTQAHKPKNHKCTICSKSFHLPSKLRQHIRMHTGERPFKCDSCEKDFTQKFYLKNHQKTCNVSAAEGN